MTQPLTPTEQQLLDIIQADFPVQPRPYQRIGDRLGLTEAEVITMLESLKTRGIIRQISAIFLGKALGFHTALISFAVPDARIEQTADVINAHPGVSHNYLRDHRFNLWFTLSVPQTLDIHGHLRALARLSDCESVLYLPGKKTFKRRVQFTISATPQPQAPGSQTLRSPAEKSRKIPLSRDRQEAIMDVLQHDLPLTSTPFLDIAHRFQVEAETFFEFARALQDQRIMSRFAAILRHRQLGYTANAMVVWTVPEPEVEAFGRYGAEQPAISHCYERATCPEWPYNLYTMIHGATVEQTQQVIDTLRHRFPNTPYERLNSVREFKKQRVNFFDHAIEKWHRQWVRREFT